MPKYSSFSWMSTFVVAGTLAATVRCSPSANVDTQFLAMKNIAHQDQAVLQPPSAIEAASCTGPVASNPSTYWLDLQDHTGNGRGYAPFLPGDFTYPVYRNVKSYNAVGDGNADDTQNLQNAINDDGNGGNRYKNEVTTRPAEVFVPGGTYKLTSHLDMRLNTILVGDPNNMPVFKASPDFNGDTVVNGSDYATVISDGTTAFLTAMKNIIIDTTSIAPDTTVLALQWGVAQACQLTNVKINMPTNSKGHTGIALDQGSTTAVTDVSIVGGAVGIRNSNQQVNFKSISFSRCTTGMSLTGGYVAVIQNATFDTCGFGINADNGGGPPGSIIILDSTSINSGPVIKYHDSSNDNGDRNNQIVIENLSQDGANPIAVDSNGNTKLGSSSITDTWIWGNVDPGNYQTGKNMSTPRASGLLSGGKYFTMAQPTYGEYAADQFVNVKAVNGSIVKGDGSTDDSASLNAILAANAANCKISYFPYGVYIVKSTLFVPPGTRIVGEAWSVISGIGSTFGDANNPQPVVQIGNVSDVGVAQIQDMRFTVADISPGAIILQVNMAGFNQGDVGIWNSHVTVGGTADTNVNIACSSGNTADCKAAFAMVHLTSSSSAYIENMWGWTADHSLERGGHQNIATGRGLLVEATNGTWLTGTAFEHNTLYNYNLHNAENVYAGMQQTETAYWQGVGSQQNAPAPWTPNGVFGDPDFSWCAGGGGQACQMGLALNVDGGSDLFLYGAAFWTFFHGEVSTCYSCAATICGVGCITNQARVVNGTQGLYWFGINSRAADVMVLDDGADPQQRSNPGGWNCGNQCSGGVIAAYLTFEGTGVGKV